MQAKHPTLFSEAVGVTMTSLSSSLSLVTSFFLLLAPPFALPFGSTANDDGVTWLRFPFPHDVIGRFEAPVLLTLLQQLLAAVALDADIMTSCVRPETERRHLSITRSTKTNKNFES